VDIPGSSGGIPIFQFSSRPVIQDHRLTLSGYITDRADLAGAEWTLQVWQSQYEVNILSNCTTERPVAFIMPPTGSGTTFIPASTSYEWTYCIQGQGWKRKSEVPWLHATSWGLTERKRQRITQPRIWDFSAAVDLNDQRVKDLEYKRPAGWTVLVWTGDTLVAREWIGF
jgi:hypothetical protein